MRPCDTAAFATAQAGSTAGRMAASQRFLGFTLAATSGRPVTTTSDMPTKPATAHDNSIEGSMAQCQHLCGRATPRGLLSLA